MNALRSRSPSGSPQRRWPMRIAFTLTELLVVMAIIGLLASSILFAMWGAIEQAKVARTRTQITKLNELLMSRWEGYQTRAIRLGLPLAVRRTPRVAAEVRLHALRDLMRMEMPDRREDVSDPPVNISVPGHPAVFLPIASLQREYGRRATQNNTRPFDSWTAEFEDSECLYMIIASIRDLDSNGLDFLREGEIGDLDGDGMPEILDAWGRPIAFIRWPSGFVAHPGSDFTWGNLDDIPYYTDQQRVIPDPDAPLYVASEIYDPFDPLKVDRRAAVPMPAAQGTGDGTYFFNFAIYPLVFSAGPDGVYDIVRFNNDSSDQRLPFHFYRNVQNPFAAAGRGMNDPYSILPFNPGTGRRLGEPFDSDGRAGYADNIHNHALGGQ